MGGMKPKILLAGVVGVLLVVFASLESRKEPLQVSAPTPTLTVATAVESQERSTLSVIDANKNGIDDWKEAIQQTSSNAPAPLATSTYALPKTLTEDAGIALIEGVLSSKALGPLGKNNEGIVDGVARNIISESLNDKLYTRKDIIVNPKNNTGSLRAYGHDIALSVVKHSIPKETKNETDILNDALTRDNPDGLKDLEIILKSYSNTLENFLTISVPSNLVQHHLDILNSFQATQSDIAGMKKAFDDPLFTMTRIMRYEQDVRNMATSLKNLYDTLEKKNIIYDDKVTTKFINLFQ